jgi:drug/metabolite transporter (DMT)-like permease
MSGYLSAALAVLIAASYPVATRAAVIGSFTPQELVTLRFGVGALLFLPYLLLRWPAIGRDAWLRGVPLTLFQGAGMAALVICGLQFAPASHQAALGPGIVPAWVALLGFVLFGRRPSGRIVAGALLCLAGVAGFLWASGAKAGSSALLGDLMFVAAAALAALYVLQLRRWGVGAMHAAAIVTVYSAALVVPWHLWSAAEPLWRMPPLELAWQILWQGVLTACVSFVALNHAVARLGAERAAALVALVPALSAALGAIFLGELPSAAEVAAIVAVCAGVSIAAARGYGGSPASISAPTSRAACGLSRPG